MNAVSPDIAVGAGWFWPLGILALGWSAGMSTALNILLLGDGSSLLLSFAPSIATEALADLSIHSTWGQWVLIIFCGGLGFFAITIFSSALMPWVFFPTATKSATLTVLLL